MTEDQRFETPKEAFDNLAGMSGQSYITVDTAFQHVAMWAQAAKTAWVAQYDDDADEEDPGPFNGPDRQWAVSVALRERARYADEARGIVEAWPHEQILTVADASDVLVEMVGGEPGEGMSTGGGARRDEAHKQNITTLEEAFDIEAAPGE